MMYEIYLKVRRYLAKSPDMTIKGKQQIKYQGTSNIKVSGHLEYKYKTCHNRVLYMKL